MKTFTVPEASQSLGDLLRRAVGGEKIAVNDGECTVVLQPLSQRPEPAAAKRLSPREALRRLQSCSHLTSSQADDYLREVASARYR